MSEKLALAAEEGDLRQCEFVVRSGADPNSPDFEYSPLYAASKGGHLQVCLFLIPLVENIDYQWDRHPTALYVAAELGHKRIVQLLVENGADVNAFNKHKGTPLLAAVSKGHLEICHILVQRGADVRTKDSNGLSPAAVGIIKGRVEIVGFLVSKMSSEDVNSKDLIGEKTLLHFAAEKGIVDIAKMLIAAGAHPQAKDKLGQTSLFLAASNNRTEMRRYLASLSHNSSSKT